MAPRRRPPRLRRRRDAEKIAAIHPKAPQETRNNPTLSAQTAPQRRSHSTQNSSDHRQPIKISSPFEKCGLGVSIAFAPTTWSSLAQGLAEGDFDIAMGGVSVTLDRQKIGFFSAPYLRDGKTPIARCSDQEKFQTLTDIDRPGVKVIANPGGTNERFDRARLHAADIVVYPDNLTIFDQLALGRADLMITDASETRFQAKLHPGVLCAILDQPFD